MNNENFEISKISFRYIVGKAEQKEEVMQVIRGEVWTACFGGGGVGKVSFYPIHPLRVAGCAPEIPW